MRDWHKVVTPILIILLGIVIHIKIGGLKKEVNAKNVQLQKNIDEMNYIRASYNSRITSLESAVEYMKTKPWEVRHSSSNTQAN